MLETIQEALKTAWALQVAGMNVIQIGIALVAGNLLSKLIWRFGGLALVPLFNKLIKNIEPYLKKMDEFFVGLNKHIEGLKKNSPELGNALEKQVLKRLATWKKTMES